jgi:hypothetical protein
MLGGDGSQDDRQMGQSLPLEIYLAMLSSHLREDPALYGKMETLRLERQQQLGAGTSTMNQPSLRRTRGPLELTSAHGPVGHYTSVNASLANDLAATLAEDPLDDVPFGEVPEEYPMFHALVARYGDEARLVEDARRRREQAHGDVPRQTLPVLTYREIEEGLMQTVGLGDDPVLRCSRGTSCVAYYTGAESGVEFGRVWSTLGAERNPHRYCLDCVIADVSEKLMINTGAEQRQSENLLPFRVLVQQGEYDASVVISPSTGHNGVVAFFPLYSLARRGRIRIPEEYQVRLGLKQRRRTDYRGQVNCFFRPVSTAATGTARS